jgi:hypothetical protein
MHVKLEKNAVLVGENLDLTHGRFGGCERAVFRAMPDATERRHALPSARPSEIRPLFVAA